jgi:hypothetical protein
MNAAKREKLTVSVFDESVDRVLAQLGVLLAHGNTAVFFTLIFKYQLITSTN